MSFRFVLGLLSAVSMSAPLRAETVAVAAPASLEPLVSAIAAAVPATAYATVDGRAETYCASMLRPVLLVAVRPLTETERAGCGSQLVEATLGHRALVIAAARTSPFHALTVAQLFKAFAGKVRIGDGLVPNPYVKWRDIDPSLPDARIEGLASDAGSPAPALFFDLVISPDVPSGGAGETAIRDDGSFVHAGASTLALARALVQSPTALGIVDYSALGRLGEVVGALPIDGIEPTDAAIRDGTYPLASPLYLYADKAAPEARAFLAAALSDDAAAAFGKLGFLPLPADLRAAERAAWSSN